MADAARIEWVAPPETLIAAIEEYGDRVIVAIRAIADLIATRAQNQMRQNARWTDRTGNARSGLFSVAEEAAKDVVVIWFSHGHTIDYGVYLELSHAGRYAIIAPTMERMYPEVKRLLKRLLS